MECPWTTSGTRRWTNFDTGVEDLHVFCFQTGPHFIRDGLVVQWRRDDPGGKWAIVPVTIDQ